MKKTSQNQAIAETQAYPNRNVTNSKFTYLFSLILSYE